MNPLTITFAAPNGETISWQCPTQMTVDRARTIAQSFAAGLCGYVELSRNGQWVYRFFPNCY